MRRQGFVVLSTPAGYRGFEKSEYMFTFNGSFLSYSQIVSESRNFSWCAFPLLFAIWPPIWWPISQSPIHYHHGIYLKSTCSPGPRSRILPTLIKPKSLFGRADPAALRTGILSRWLIGGLSQLNRHHRHLASPSQRRSQLVRITSPFVAMIQDQPALRLELTAGPVRLPWSISRKFLCTGLIHILRFPVHRSDNICKKNSNICCCAGMIVSRFPQSIHHFPPQLDERLEIESLKTALTKWQIFLRFHLGTWWNTRRIFGRPVRSMELERLNEGRHRTAMRTVRCIPWGGTSIRPWFTLWACRDRRSYHISLWQYKSIVI